jgi:tetratricopeptide (TPR) repeat protein
MDISNPKSESFLIKYRAILFIVLLGITIFGTYSRVITYDFINFDDPAYVTSNNTVQKGFSSEGFRYAFNFRLKNNAYWHPLTWLSHMLDCHLFGLDASMHHLTSILLHIFNSMLLFLAFYLMTGGFLPSALVAALFALHPINVDSVVWIAERKNVLSTFFWLLTMLSYVFYSRKPGTGRYLIVLVTFILGLLAKPMLATLPCALLLMDFWPMQRIGFRAGPAVTTQFPGITPLRAILEKIPMLAFSIITIGLSSYSLRVQGILYSASQVPMLLRIENAIVSYVKYIFKIILPIDLAIYYPFPDAILLWKVISTAVFLIATSGLVISRLRPLPYLAVGWFWFLGTLVPVIGLVQGGIWPEIADRWAYVPQIGFFIMIVWPISKYINTAGAHGKLVGIVVGVLLLALMAATWVQSGYWKNSKTLFSRALSVAGDNFLVHTYLGDALIHEENYADAIVHLKKALPLAPIKTPVHLMLASAYRGVKHFEDAILHYLEAIKLDAEELFPYAQLGILLAGKKQHSDDGSIFDQNPAIDARNKVQAHPVDSAVINEVEKKVLKQLALAPQNAKILFNVGSFYGEQERYDQENFYLEKAIALDPDFYRAHYHLGIVAAKQNRTRAAEKHFLSAITSNPESNDAHNGLGLLFSTTGRQNRAIVQFEKALKLDSKNSQVRVNLANALALAGRLSEALHQYASILEIDPEHVGAREGYDRTNSFLSTIDSEIESTQALLAYDPENPALLGTLGDLYSKRGNSGRAIEYYQKLQSLYSEHLGVLNKLAAAYARIKNYDQARLHFEKAVAIAPDNPASYYNVACMYSRLNETVEALKWIKIAVEKGYDKWQKIETDEDLENVRKTEGFKELFKGK